MSDFASYATFALGMTAAAMTTGSWIPQALKTIRSRSAGDFAWSYLALFGGGVFLWMVYGIFRQDPVIFGANLLTLGLVLRIMVVKRTGR
jgi:MtN3 and saliva related transmembrane protein